MNRRLMYVLAKTIPLWVVFALFLFFGVYIPFGKTFSLPQDGPILFWQDGAIYTINADGTNLTKLTPAIGADQRYTAVAPGCSGQSSTICWVLIGHVLYDALGRGVPLPLNNALEWVDAPATWSPDGIHIAYAANRKTDGQRVLLIYDTAQNIVWQAAVNTDDSIKPAWSAECVDGVVDNCYLAFGQKSASGQTGKVIVAQNLSTGSAHTWTIPSSQGHILRWSTNNELYYGGRLGWFAVVDGRRVSERATSALTMAPSPAFDQVAYYDIRPAEDGVSAATILNLASIAGDPLRTIYVFPSTLGRMNIQARQIFWAPNGSGLAAYNQGLLLHYDLQAQTMFIWYKTPTAGKFSSYAFAPSGDRVALVESQYLEHQSTPQNRLLVVSRSGDVVTLRPRSSGAIVLLAWLPQHYTRYFLPRNFAIFS